MFIILKMQKEHLKQVEEISKMEFQNTTWTFGQFEKEIDNTYVCVFDEKVVGFLCLLMTFDEMTILNIAVLNDFKRKKIATNLLEFAKKIAKEKNISNIFLEVETENFIAVTFYKKNGFETLRTRKNYYKDGKSCIEMRLKLLN